MIILSAYHDPNDIFSEQLATLKSKFGNLPKVIFAVSPSTDSNVLKTLNSFSNIETVPGGLWGEARKLSLAHAIKTYPEENQFFFVDHDRLLHWLEFFSDELFAFIAADSQLNSLLESSEDTLVVVGRKPQAFKSHPESWQRTETIINDLLSDIVDLQIDPYSGSYAINRNLAEKIVNQLKETSWASVSELVLKSWQQSARIESIFVEGLEWEDPDRFKLEISKFDRFSHWENWRYGSLSEWQKRINSINSNIDFIIKNFPKLAKSFSNVKISKD